MAGSLRLQLFLCALVFMVGIGLIAAIQPVPPPAAAATAAAPTPQHFRRPPGAFAGQRGMAHPRTRFGDGAAVAPGFRPRHDRYWRRPPRFAPASPSGDFTFDGWRLLGALALTGGVASVLWASLCELRAAPASKPIPARLERDVTALREEVERLQREQRQLQMTLDWQERLLKHTNTPELAAGPALAEHGDDA